MNALSSVVQRSGDVIESPKKMLVRDEAPPTNAICELEASSMSLRR